MEKEQELEWLEAQKIVVSLDLVGAAKQQLKFLAAVDRHRCLYDGPVLDRAIFRYKKYWLPLLAEYGESEVLEGPLVVPLDCEWIWHCHRLNPIRYKVDCEDFFGRILDNKNVLSMVHGASKKETEEIWNRLYPEEPYELDLTNSSSEKFSEKILSDSGSTTYDLILAVKRQSPFFYQVSRPCMNDDHFLEGALSRYKGFLHLIKRNKERSIRRFCVPTYEVDLIWHTHQLHPVSYGKDMIEALGKVLEHDDTDSNRTKGQKLDVGFSETTKQWEDTFGYRYWRAGAMYRGTPPSPVAVSPWRANDMDKNIYPSGKSSDEIQVPQTDVVEVLLEIVGVRNMPEGRKSDLFVYCSKKKPDSFFKEKRRLSIFSEYGQKQVAAFPCEFSGELLFELMSPSHSSLPISRLEKSLGSTTISLHDLLNPISKLSVDKWFDLQPTTNSLNSKPISLRIAVSITVPAPAQYLLQMVRSNPFLRNTCFTPLGMGNQQAKSNCLVDEVGNEIISLQMRDAKKANMKISSISKKQVIGVMRSSGEVRVLAELGELGWSFVDSECSYQLRKNSGKESHIFDLKGNRMFKLFPGRKLDYDPKSCKKQRNERYFVTVVEFSADYPYGNAMALLNLKSGVLEVKEKWFLLPAVTLAFVLSDMVKKDGLGILLAGEENLNSTNLDVVVEGHETTEKHGNKSGTLKEASLEPTPKGNAVAPDMGGNMVRSGGGCGSGCGSGCNNMVNSGGCSGCGSGGCGNMVNAGGHGGCGGGCGGSGGCGNMVSSGGHGGCGGGCGGGGGCGNMVSSEGHGGCGGGCGGGGGCGNMVSSGGSGGCGGGCGGSGGCGNMVGSGGCSGCGGGCGGSGGCGNMVSSGGCGGGCGGSGGCGNMVTKTEECGAGDKLPVDSVALVVGAS